MPEALRGPVEGTADAAALQEAFARFQRHCEQLAQVHDALRAQLDRRVQEIERMKEQLADILESITDAVLLVDADGAVEVANGAAHRLFGALETTESIPGLEPLLQADAILRDEELCLALPDGRRDVIATAVPKAGTAGRPGARVIAIKDMTEQVRLQERLRQAQRMAELGQMAASVAHQIRNPLTGVEGFAQLLQRDLDARNPRAAHMAERIVQAARRVGDIIANMMVYADQPANQTVPTDVAQIARDAVDSITPWASDLGVPIRWSGSDEASMVPCDGRRLRLVVGNLLANALEACRDAEHGCIELRLESSSEAVRLEIRDNGIGIPAESIARVREPFFSLNQHGLGLGLAVAERFAQAHEGRLQVESAAGAGTRIALELPTRMPPS